MAIQSFGTLVKMKQESYPLSGRLLSARETFSIAMTSWNEASQVAGGCVTVAFPAPSARSNLVLAKSK